MANPYQIVIEGHVVKELRCKNDECRELIGYDNIVIGVFIRTCPKCGHLNIYKMQYKAHGKKLIEELQEKFKKGGE